MSLLTFGKFVVTNGIMILSEENAATKASEATLISTFLPVLLYFTAEEILKAKNTDKMMKANLGLMLFKTVPRL